MIMSESHPTRRVSSSYPNGRRCTRFLRVAVASCALFVLSAIITPATAQGTECGPWWPGSGVTSTRIDKIGPDGKSYVNLKIRNVFVFSDAEIAALRCKGSRALEVDAVVYGKPSGGYSYFSSNFPGGGYLDIEASDSFTNEDNTRTLTVGTDQAQELQPNKEYYTEYRLERFSFGSEPKRVDVYINFQPGRWANYWHPVEHGACFFGSRELPEWCVFEDGMRKRLTTEVLNGESAYIEYTGQSGADSVYWGKYRKTELLPGETLDMGAKLYSPNGLNYLVMRYDGNLVEYIPGKRPVWASGTSTSPGAVLVAQTDGNFVVVAPGNRPVWSTRTKVPGSVLQVHDDQNAVVYAPGHRAIWSNATAGGK